MKNKFNNTLSIIISIAFIITAFFGSIHYFCFNERFYEKEHSKIMLYGKHINEHIGISDEDLKQITSFTLDYLNDPDASLDIQMNVKGKVREIYTDDEKLHMEDVRSLNLAANYILIFSSIVLVISSLLFILKKGDIKLLFIKYKKIISIFMIFFAFLGLWIFIDFDSFWTFFHHIFFAGNDLWLLDLRKDILIMIVPPEFFNDLVIRIVITFVLLICLGYIVLYLLKRKKNIND